MSHIVTIRTQVRDPMALAAACRRLGLGAPVKGTAQLFAAQASGWIVQLPRWNYPVVIDTDAGTVRFDNFNGHWGEQAQLDRLLQIYAVEKARAQAQRQGHRVSEQTLPDGSIRLNIHVGGHS
jgi:hypothetical protein